MTDEELIARLRHYAHIAHAAAAWGFAGEGEVMSRAADRIEALVRELTASNEIGKAFEEDAGQQRARAERLEAALRKASVQLDWCQAAREIGKEIDAALKGADHE